MTENMTDDFLQIARNMAEASGGRVRLVTGGRGKKGEADTGRRLEYQGQAVGRDMEVYGFRATLSETGGDALADFFEGSVMPFKSSVPEAYRAGVDGCRAIGRKVFAGEQLTTWEEILDM